MPLIRKPEHRPPRQYGWVPDTIPHRHVPGGELCTRKVCHTEGDWQVRHCQVERQRREIPEVYEFVYCYDEDGNFSCDNELHDGPLCKLRENSVILWLLGIPCR